jgi:hypothetical protein
MNIPMPLRVPELAPSLGRVIVARRREALWVPLDDIREELATAVLELAGEGRGAAAREERDQVLEITGRRAWAAAWDRAVRRAAGRVADALEAEIVRTARQVRLPHRRRRRLLLAMGEKRAIAARFGTGGAAFVAALDELDAAAARVQTATVLDKDAHAAWQEALRTAARRVEAAWLALEAEVEEERRRWTPEIETLARWRPALWPIAVVWVPVAAALIWLGLVLGGYLPAPAWLASRLGF